MREEVAATLVKDGQVTVSPAGQVVRSVIWGEPVFFTVTRPRDAIQREHLQGRFYEPEELEIIRAHCRPGSVFCDIGANTGNHSIFALKFAHASRAILFEPNPDAIEIIRSNIGLNGLSERCDLSRLGVGLSDRAAGGLSMAVKPRNLGGGRMVPDGGALTTVIADEALAADDVNFIKIDVEGMEMSVLSGLRKTVARCRPIIFVEVDDANRDAFAAWADAHRYKVRGRFRRYSANENFLLVPRSIAAAPLNPIDGGSGGDTWASDAAKGQEDA